MLLPNRPGVPRAMMSIGALFLAIAITAMKFLHPSARLGPDTVDALVGLLFGLSIGLSLAGLISVARHRRHSC